MTIIIRSALLAMLIVILNIGGAKASGRTAAPHVAGEVVVKFKPASAPGARIKALGSAGAVSTKPTGLSRTRVVELRPGSPGVERSLQKLAASADVVWAEPNYIYTTNLVPNDPLFADGSLWGLQNTGQSVEQYLDSDNRSTDRSGMPGIDIGAVEAWDETTGSDEVLVGVADSGVSPHPDLNANLRFDLAGDFRADEPDQYNARVDGSGHGSHVAGTIGAVGDNATGITGINWDVGIVPLRALDGSSGTSVSIAMAFSRAGQLGLPIVNASIGGPGKSRLIMDSIRLASDTLFVLAAGNNGIDHDAPDAERQYPCDYGYPNMVCVAATGNVGDLAGFSDFGKRSVDLAAPGSGIKSTVPVIDAAHEFDLQSPFSDNWETEGDADWSIDDLEGSTEKALTTPTVAPGQETQSTVLAEPLEGALEGRIACTLDGVANVAAVDANGDPSAALVIETSTDGITWRQTPPLTDTSEPILVSYGIQADDADAFLFRAKWITFGTAVGEQKAQIARLAVKCNASPNPGEYDIYNGTSMAAPHVAGAAALMLSKRPDLGVAELREALLSSATPLGSLKGKTVTGGMLNLPGALAAIEPEPAPDPDPPAPDPAPDPKPVIKLRMQPGPQNLRRNRGVAFRVIASDRSSVVARAVVGWRPTVVNVGRGSRKIRGGRIRLKRLIGSPASGFRPGARLVGAHRVTKLRLTANRSRIRRLARLNRLGVNLRITLGARAVAAKHASSATIFRSSRIGRAEVAGKPARRANSSRTDIERDFRIE